MAVVRGCGTRKEGGIYVTVPLGDGLPIECFLVCSPKTIDLDVAPQGMTPLTHNGVTHLIDWVGSAYYPNVADFVEEARRFGISRRIPKLPHLLKQIGPGSRLLLMHSRARIENTWYRSSEVTAQEAERILPQWVCPHEIAAAKLHFDDPRESERQTELAHVIDDMDAQKDKCCLGAAWCDVQGGTDFGTTPTPYAVRRAMPSFSYIAKCAPDGYTRRYRPAIFASFPIAHLEVVDGEGADESMEIAQESGFDVQLCDD